MPVYRVPIRADVMISATDEATAKELADDQGRWLDVVCISVDGEPEEEEDEE